MEAQTTTAKKLVSVDPADWDLISREAFERSISRSELVRSIVRSYLDGRLRIGPDAGPAAQKTKRHVNPNQ